MTSDPKAPGAAAVYLYREETSDDTLHFHSMYVKIKVLTEKGKELATVRIPYERRSFKVTDVQGRTIHADGTVIPLTAKPSDLTDMKTKDYQVNTMVFTLPSVEVGSILEYRLQIRYEDNVLSSPTWDVQQPYFVHKAHYFFAPSTAQFITNSRGDAANNLMYAVRDAGTAKVAQDSRNRYTFDVADVPAFPDDDWMPPLNALRWRVEFYYTPYMTGPEFWKNEGKRWVKEAEHFDETTKTLREAGQSLVAASDTEEQKARKIYDAVMKLENTSFTREKSEAERKKEKIREIRSAEDVWNQKSGSADDLALLYAALARGAGLTAYPMEVVDRNRAIFDPTYLSTNQLDDYIAVVMVNGKEVYLDPGQKQCPYGLLHWKHTMAGGLRLASIGPSYGFTPNLNYQQTELTRVAEVTLDEDGNVKGSARFVMSGEEALRWRHIALENDESEVKKQFNESIREDLPEGVQADFDHFLSLDDYNTNLMAIVKLTGAMGSATGKRFFLPGLFFESRAKHPFVAEEKRTVPIDVHYPELVQDDVTYHLPSGMTVESSPEATNLSWPAHTLLKIHSTVNGNTGIGLQLHSAGLQGLRGPARFLPESVNRGSATTGVDARHGICCQGELTMKPQGLIGRVVVWSVLAVAFLLATQPASGSWFSKGQPVPDWGMEAAKTKVPDYAKDAAAVILYDEYVETIDANGRAVEREREAIRILKPQGRGNTCGVSFSEDEKVTAFRAWTIAPDEKTYQAQDTDFADVGDTSVPIMLSTTRRRVVHLPAVDVDAIEICETEEVMAPYAQEKMWQIQTGIPIVYQALEVDLPQGRTYTSTWHSHPAVAPAEVAPGHFRWEIRDQVALDLRDIPSHPKWGALAARMDVEWGDAAVAGLDNEWRAIGQWVTKLEADRPTPSAEITAQTQQLIAGAPDFYTRLQRITDYIQKNIRYFVVMRGIGGLQANHAADIFRNRYGDCKDKTTLLISMLQVAGIHAFYVPVDSERGVVDPLEPSLYGNHMITAIEIPADVTDKRLQALVTAKDGKRYLIFDPTDERTPVGNLPSDEQGSYGLLSAGPQSQVLALPVLPPDANGTERKGMFSLAADGTLTGTVDSLHTGPEGADIRMFLKYTDEKERHDAWETSLAQDLPGVVLKSLKFVQPPALDKPLEFHYEVAATQYAHHAGPLLLVRPRVVGSDSLSFDQRERTVPIEMGATGRWRDSFDITLPDGFVVDETPDPVDLETDFASYHSKIVAKGNTLHYERDYEIKQVELPAEKAAEFRKLQSIILADERGTAVLKKQ
ncbi:MAG TPA: DUF3857 domain-containing protein [Terracidiphilus sp.]|jgi:transglutaminase-like putative cysteine protease|nr:DUF3857 domain-containing protein [Terracidiphilus sp.]